MEEENVRNKILYVDDDEKSRILLRKILQAEGFVVSEAADGLEACEKVSQERPDLIIMDLQMPGMDGFDALKRIHEMPGLTDVAAIALTGRGIIEERDKIIKAGYDGYLSKPIQRLELIEEIDRLLTPEDRRISGFEEETLPLRDDELCGRKLLLVDDNPIHLQMGEKIFSSAGMQIFKAPDGREALEILESGEKPDIILSDILMPRMDGYQFCRLVKTTGAFLEVPFVFYTSTYVDNSDIRFGLDLGAERYIIRPIPSSRLLEIVKEVLKGHEAGKAASMSVSQDAFMVDDVKYYREYNERLVSKLEQKLLEIDNAYRTLEMRNEELRNFSEKLEEKVKERTAELEEANRSLRKQDEEKTEFLNIVAHDLRTPMTTIRSYAELLLKYKDEPASTREEFLGIIINESIRLGNLVTDYLDVAKIQSGLYHFKEEPVDLISRITHTLNLLRARAEAKDIVIETHLVPEVQMINGDPDKIDQLLINLLSNAVKFSDRGGRIEIHACTVAAGERPALPCSSPPSVEQESAAVMIRDNGPGIPEIYQESIFEKFSQIDSSLVRESGGTGLGLSIVNWIVDHYNGKVWVESREEEGSAFFLILPVLQQ